MQHAPGYIKNVLDRRAEASSWIPQSEPIVPLEDIGAIIPPRGIALCWALTISQAAQAVIFEPQVDFQLLLRQGKSPPRLVSRCTRATAYLRFIQIMQTLTGLEVSALSADGGG